MTSYDVVPRSGFERGDMPLDAVRSAFEWLVVGPHPVGVDGRLFPGLPTRPVPLDELRDRLLNRRCPQPPHRPDPVRRRPSRPDRATAAAGDLVFYGTPGDIHHVGLYIGVGLMINAPTFGQPVQIDHYRYNGDDYAEATRPAAPIAVAASRVDLSISART